MKTIIFVLKHRLTVKQLIACSTEKLLVFNNSPILLGAPSKKTSKNQPPTPRKMPSFRPPPLRISVASVGRVWIFSVTTQFAHSKKTYKTGRSLKYLIGLVGLRWFFKQPFLTENVFHISETTYLPTFSEYRKADCKDRRRWRNKYKIKMLHVKGIHEVQILRPIPLLSLV